MNLFLIFIRAIQIIIFLILFYLLFKIFWLQKNEIQSLKKENEILEVLVESLLRRELNECSE